MSQTARAQDDDRPRIVAVQLCGQEIVEQRIAALQDFVQSLAHLRQIAAQDAFEIGFDQGGWRKAFEGGDVGNHAAPQKRTDDNGILAHLTIRRGADKVVEVGRCACQRYGGQVYSFGNSSPCRRICSRKGAKTPRI